MDKSSLKMPKIVNFGEFLKTCKHSVARQVKNGEKCQKLQRCDILNNFQTLCNRGFFLSHAKYHQEKLSRHISSSLTIQSSLLISIEVLKCDDRLVMCK